MTTVHSQISHSSPIIPKLPGSYVLIINLPFARELLIGRLGSIYFPQGYYAYAGSALGSGGLNARIGRHLRLVSKKRIVWHIDHLTSVECIEEAWWMAGSQRQECTWADIMSQIGRRLPPRFGASDCRCPGHLIWLDTADEVENAWLALRSECKDNLRWTRFGQSSSSPKQPLAQDG
jgi:Uri superfamily endonuclease